MWAPGRIPERSCGGLLSRWGRVVATGEIIGSTPRSAPGVQPAPRAMNGGPLPMGVCCMALTGATDVVAVPGLDIVGELGHGAHAVVYRVRRQGAEFALKLLRLSGDGDGRATVAFRREAGLVGCVNQPAGELSGDSVAGTVAYAAPEQTGMLKRPVDGRADLYALGVVLFECLTGERPFAATDAGELIRLHATAPAPSVRALRPEVCPALAAVVAKLLAKDPDDRYQT